MKVLETILIAFGACILLILTASVVMRYMGVEGHSYLRYGAFSLLGLSLVLLLYYNFRKGQEKRRRREEEWLDEDDREL